MEAVVALAARRGRASRPARVAVPARRRVGEGGRGVRAASRALARDDRARAALRAAGRLYRDNGRLDRAADVYRAIVERRPADVDAWRRSTSCSTELGRWRELADVRGALARAGDRRREGGAAPRAGARARAGRRARRGGRARRSGRAARARRRQRPRRLRDVLAREGRGREAAEVLAARIDEAIERGAPAARSRRCGCGSSRCTTTPAIAAPASRGPRRSCSRVAPEYVPGARAARPSAPRDADPRVHAAALWLRPAAGRWPATALRALTEAAQAFGEARDHRAAAARARAGVRARARRRRAARGARDARTRRRRSRARRDELAAGDRAAAPSGGCARSSRAPARHRGEPRARRRARRARPRAERLEHLVGETARRHRAGALPDVARSCTGYARAVADARRRRRGAPAAARGAPARRAATCAITLALGESCFARKLWREAAIHLGSLADHPDAAAHAAAVAARPRPRGAGRDPRAAAGERARSTTRPRCSSIRRARAAWHALAELAMREGRCRARDRVPRARGGRDARAARSAAALTTRSAISRTACSAISARAERCWARGAAGASRSLEKLLARAAQARRRRRARRDLRAARRAGRRSAREGAARGSRAGVRRPAATSRARAPSPSALVAEHPLDLDAVACATSVRDATPVARSRRGCSARSPRGIGPASAATAIRGAPSCGAGSAMRSAHAATRPARCARISARSSTAPESDGALAARRGLVELARRSGRDANIVADRARRGRSGSVATCSRGRAVLARAAATSMMRAPRSSSRGARRAAGDDDGSSRAPAAADGLRRGVRRRARRSRAPRARRRRRRRPARATCSSCSARPRRCCAPMRGPRSSAPACRMRAASRRPARPRPPRCIRRSRRRSAARRRCSTSPRAELRARARARVAAARRDRPAARERARAHRRRRRSHRSRAALPARPHRRARAPASRVRDLADVRAARGRALHAFAASGEVDDDTLDEAERLRSALPLLLRKKLAELLAPRAPRCGGAISPRASARPIARACSRAATSASRSSWRVAPTRRATSSSSRRASATSRRARSCARGGPDHGVRYAGARE